MRLESIPVAGDLKSIRELWEPLESGSNASYFLSWGWIENWLTSLPDAARPTLMVLREEGAPLLAFFIGKVRLSGLSLFNRRTGSGDAQQEHINEIIYCGRHLFSRRGWFLNATGNPAFDRIHIEYNGFLQKRQDAVSLPDVLHSLPDSWDEIYFQGIDARSFPESLTPDALSPCEIIVDREMAAPFVDLNMIRNQGKDYLSLLSANTRAQIRKSYRLCEQTPVQLETATDVQEAMNIFDEMVALHEQAWTTRGVEGAFSTEYLYQFHKNLILKRFMHNEIQMLRITCGDQTAGCLYNFVYRNNVYFYQSGINYNLDNQLKPGYLSHVEAIRHNLAAGRHVYDFLGGEERYKMSLATHHNRLIWMRVQKPLLKFRIERMLKKINKIRRIEKP
ncbi:MAG: hypothetical protein C0394_00565 [Syntrophus sp. (in: bacteria)]|nr:hypothetical protein [Syntrophus sp. (in: bacteria)]